MNKKVFVVAAHPDDIEFMMAGTLLLLLQRGYEVHYMVLTNGSCGTAILDKDKISSIRVKETRTSAESVGAVFHPPLLDDLEIYYDQTLASKLCAVVRKVAPEILLLPSPEDYMEDHQNASRLMITAAFCRNMKNFPTDPPTPPIDTEMAVYHAAPYGLVDPLRRLIVSDFYIDIGSVLAAKRQMLACHRSQKEWLDHSQGLDSYLKTMEDMCAQMGRMSGKFRYAEGWRRHNHLGFGPEKFDPLTEALNECITFTK